MTEDPRYLKEQIITYLGNKRSLLSFIGTAVRDVTEGLKKEKLDTADIFSGSGVVSRYLKAYSDNIFVNDLEDYAETISRCYLTNKCDIDPALTEKYCAGIRSAVFPLRPGFITELYSPADENDIRPGERAFYTPRNAMYLDTARRLLDEVPEPYRTLLLAPLIYEASVHTNTGGVFKGFYKSAATGVGKFGGDGANALERIKGEIELRPPVLSNFTCRAHVYKQDALKLDLPTVDLCYIDPPYNQHPYGSNYFMLNLINNYVRPENISPVSGIPRDWNKSPFNVRSAAREAMAELCASVNARYLLISFSSEGFISPEEMTAILRKTGTLTVLSHSYPAFRASRNLKNRGKSLTEYLYLVKKI